MPIHRSPGSSCNVVSTLLCPVSNETTNTAYKPSAFALLPSGEKVAVRPDEGALCCAYVETTLSSLQRNHQSTNSAYKPGAFALLPLAEDGGR